MAPPKKAILLGLFFVFVIYRIIVASKEEESLDSAALYETKEGTWLVLKQRIVLQVVFRTDESGLNTLPQFIEHYISFGLKPEDFYVTLQGKGTDKAIEVLNRYKIANYEKTPEDYSEYLLYLEYTRLLHKLKLGRTDWILSPNMDEFYWFPTNIYDYGQSIDVTTDFVLGHIVDRFSQSGKLLDVEPRPSIWVQYPLECDVAKTHAQMMFDYRVAMHRGSKAMERVFTRLPEFSSQPKPHPDTLTVYRFSCTPYHFAQWTATVNADPSDVSSTMIFLSEIVRHIVANKNKFCVECDYLRCQTGFDPQR